MLAVRQCLAAALALVVTGCASEGMARRARHSNLPPPAGVSRAGVRDVRGAGPARAFPGSTEAERAVDAAASLLGRRRVPADGLEDEPGCAALVRLAYARAGRPLPPEASDAAAIHALAERRGQLHGPAHAPEPGDVLFLADRPGGPPMHAAIVARREADGTLLVIHRTRRGVVRLRANPAWPTRMADASGRKVNDALVVDRRALPAGGLVIDSASLLAP
ncbi:C40 family peptidase [Anaeromyxobacter paludicola]|uniref:NlpC/P60 domain-containing protein n=1 Tax=Anaeromyxobacter paludicola TaxID=2918171 RepID=A0ABM7X7A0_9BACT|nr:CHAP domain-containing protein [Anaeromyxobacter paludicola]BDG07699.1 hypothetical protein AMPC_08120 [Anaeromyxobacter paludicola]